MGDCNLNAFERTLLVLSRKLAQWVPEEHWKAIMEILGFKEPAKASSSKSLCFSKDHTQNIFVWLLKEDDDTTGRVLCCLEKQTPWSHGETGLKFSNLNILLLFQGFSTSKLGWEE